MSEARSLLRWIAIGAWLLALLSSRVLAAERRIEVFDPAQYTGEMGTLALPLKGEALLAVVDTENSRILRLSSATGSFQLPVGKYRLMAYVAFAMDASQERWGVSGTLEEAKAREITVAANASQTLALGPPLTASITIVRNGEEAELAFNLTGRGGDLCVIRKTNSSTALPSFQVVSPGGQILWEESFKFG